MPLSTRTIAKGIPPKGHLAPKGKKAVSKSSNKNTKNAKNKKNKRNADSDSDESDEPVVKKKKSVKRQCVESEPKSEPEVEIIDEDAIEAAEVEEVDVIRKTAEDEDNEVSTTFH